MPSFVYGEGVYSAEEIDRINAIAEAMPAGRVVVGKDLTFTNRGAFEFKGFPEPVPVYELAWD